MTNQFCILQSAQAINYKKRRNPNSKQWLQTSSSQGKKPINGQYNLKSCPTSVIIKEIQFKAIIDIILSLLK